MTESDYKQLAKTDVIIFAPYRVYFLKKAHALPSCTDINHKLWLRFIGLFETWDIKRL